MQASSGTLSRLSDYHEIISIPAPSVSAIHLPVQIVLLRSEEIAARRSQWDALWEQRETASLSHHPAWLLVLERAMRQQAYLLHAKYNDATVGLLPLSLVSSLLFGRFLVSLPYLNTAGVQSDDPDIAKQLLGRAIELADELNVLYLELRHEQRYAHTAFNQERTEKVHLRLPLPNNEAELWDGFSPKVRNQIRKGEDQSLQVCWGKSELVEEFYYVFSRNMRDLGTPVYPASLFKHIFSQFPDRAEFCVVCRQRQPISAALLTHGKGITEVPSASSLRQFNTTNANMLMYWHLLQRAVERGQSMFDFGRSSEGSGTFRFKRQWGAAPSPAVWQYYVRQGNVASMRPESERNQRLVRAWQKMPLWLSRQLGPAIVRGIP